jgi:hypothetical protein
MSSRLLLLWSVPAVLLVAAPAPAAMLPFVGSLTLRFGGSSAPIDVELTGSGVATVNGSGSPGALTALSLPSGVFSTAGAVFPVTDPDLFPILGIQITGHNDAGAFAGTGGGLFGGAMPLGGTARICLIATCGAPPNPYDIFVPLSGVGAAGTATLPGTINVTVQGAPWTIGPVSVDSVIAATGFAHGPLSLSGSTAQAGGALQLVTPIRISTDLFTAPTWPSVGILSIQFVPEPGAGLLVATGVAALTMMGQRRRRGTAPPPPHR